MNPISVAAIPPNESGIIIAERAGTDNTAYDVPSAPINESPVVLYTVPKNLLTPIFVEMKSLVDRLLSETLLKLLSLEKRNLLT